MRVRVLACARVGVHVYGVTHWLGDENIGLQSGSSPEPILRIDCSGAERLIHRDGDIVFDCKGLPGSKV